MPHGTVTDGGLFPGTRIRSSGKGRYSSKFLDSTNLKVTTRSLLKTVGDIMTFLTNIDGYHLFNGSEAQLFQDDKPNKANFKKWVRGSLLQLKEGKTLTHGGKPIVNAIYGSIQIGNESIYIKDEFYFKNLKYLFEKMPQKIDGIVSNIAGFCMEYMQKYKLIWKKHGVTGSVSTDADLKAYQKADNELAAIRDKYVRNIEKSVDPFTNPAAAKAAADTSAKRQQAAKGLQNLEDTSFGKAPAADAQKPASGKQAKVKATKKPSGGAREHDPNAKAKGESNLRGARQRRPSRNIRWGRKMFEWEIKK